MSNGKASNVLEHHDGIKTVHLPHDYGVTTFQALCGLCDVTQTIQWFITNTERPVDCKACMGVLKHVLSLAAHRGVIRSKPRDSSLECARTAP